MDKVTSAIIIGALGVVVVVGGYFIFKESYQAPTGLPTPEKVAPGEEITIPSEEVASPSEEEAITPASTEEPAITPEATPEPEPEATPEPASPPSPEAPEDTAEPLPGEASAESGEPTPEPEPEEMAETIVSHIVEADDNGLYPATITVPAGVTVNLTFKVRSTNVYFGGLDFRSSKFSTSKVPPGEETTVNFTATESFPYSSYWPSSGRKKADGMITVNP